MPPSYDLGRPAHLLLVDDSTMNLTIMKACCDLFKATYDTAEDGLEAVEALKLATYDAVLMDIRMPGMDGLQATRVIAQMGAPASQTPIIGVTGDVTSANRTACLAAGMREVIEKPVRIELLFAALEAAVGVHVLWD